MADAQTPVLTDEQARYRFLLGFLIERGVLTDKRYGTGTWCLRGVYGVDDSGLKGAGRSPEEALDNAIVAANLDPVAAQKFWSEPHAALELQGCACRWRADEIVRECEVHTAWRDTLHEYAERLRDAAQAPAQPAEPVAWRSRHRSEIGMIGHYPWFFMERVPTSAMLGSFEVQPLYAHPAPSHMAVMQQALDALQTLHSMQSEWHAAFPEHVGDKEAPAMQAARTAIAALSATMEKP